MKRRKRTNSRIAGGIGTTAPDAASWRAFDDLPRPVRMLMWQTTLPLNPVNIAALVEMGGEHAAIAGIVDAITRERWLFAEQYRRQTGTMLPHIAAGATLQDYERNRR